MLLKLDKFSERYPAENLVSNAGNKMWIRSIMVSITKGQVPSGSYLKKCKIEKVQSGWATGKMFG